MSLVVVACSGCGGSVAKPAGEVNRAQKAGYRLYCTRACAGLARRVEPLPEEEQKRLKAEYDAKRREELREEIKAKKREYFQRTYDPVKAREERKGKMPYHLEYCRRYYADPVRKKGKHDYDIQRAGAMNYAEFAEAWRLLVELEREIRTRCPDKYERAKARGYYDKFNERKNA